MITAPADGPVSSTDRTDAAEAAAVILAGDRAFDGPVTLTAGQAVTFDDVAAMASRIGGREVTRIVVDDEQWIADKVTAGSPEAMARMTLSFQRPGPGHLSACRADRR